MYRRILCFFCAILVLAALPISASADTQETLCDQIAGDYRKVCAVIGKSPEGYCGLLVGWQMYYAGINKTAITQDGNKQFDTYRDMQYTTGGYRVEAYGAENYSLRAALDAVTNDGTKNVRNLLVGFERTNTEEGTQFGHAVFVYAILDGVVYFTEGFTTSFGTAGGEPILTSIDGFVSYYDDWTVFDGLAVFCEDTREQECTAYPADVYIKTVRDTPVLSQPCEASEPDCRIFRTAQAGERIPADKLLRATKDRYYYRISDCGRIGYLDAKAAQPVSYRQDCVSVENAAAKTALQPGEEFSLTGMLCAPEGTVNALRLDVRSPQGRAVYAQDVIPDGSAFSVSSGKLPEGRYICRLYASEAYCLLTDHGLSRRERSVLFLRYDITVGTPAPGTEVPEEKSAEVRQGWVCREGKWYYLKDAVPRTGWLCEGNVRYLLLEDGSAATGWVTLNGQKRLYTQTGALCIGWLYREDGKSYIYANGNAAKGVTCIDGKYYIFDDEGFVCTGGWYEHDGQKYYLNADGSAAVGITEVEERMFLFGRDGHLLTEIRAENGSSYAVSFIGENLTDGKNIPPS